MESPANLYYSKERKRTYASRPLKERFWERVNKTDGCWLWKGAVGSHGYGTVFIQKRPNIVNELAHRVSWKLNVSEIPTGMQILHKCDVRRCVNPDHLFLGTQKDNIQDCKRKGRLVVPRKLTFEQHDQIRSRLSCGESVAILAKEFNVTPRAIRYIKNVMP